MPIGRSEPHNDVFLLVLKALEEVGVLKELVLIGSWCLLLYRHHFGGSDLIPAVRTTDVDLLVLRPGKPMQEADVPKALADVGFQQEIAWATGYAKYNREGFVVEFLSPLRGDGTVQQMTRFLMESEEGRAGLLWALSRLTKKERQAVLRITADTAPLLSGLFQRI